MGEGEQTPATVKELAQTEISWQQAGTTLSKGSGVSLASRAADKVPDSIAGDVGAMSRMLQATAASCPGLVLSSGRGLAPGSGL